MSAAVATPMIHVFERAGLGKAPFKLMRVEERTYQACQGAPVQPGTCCDFCMTAIRITCIIRDARGHEFKVGSDCVRKTGDQGLVRKLTDAQREKRHAANASKHQRDMLRIWTAWARRDQVA